MSQDKIFELIEKLYSEMQKGFEKVNGRFEKMNLKLDQKADKRDVIRIENTLMPKIEFYLTGINR